MDTRWGGGDFSRVKKVIEIVEIFKGCGTHLQALQWSSIYQFCFPHWYTLDSCYQHI